MKPTTAVIFAAGTGTRMLPVTSAVQKELLPIGNRPVIDYVVSDLVAAGVNHIIFVTRPGTHGLQDYFVGNDDLKRALERLGKTEALAQLDAIHRQAAFEFVEQPESAGYGTAIPLQNALPLLSADETIIACGGDDFVWRHNGSSETKDFVETFQASGGEGAIMALEMKDPSQLHHYGVLSTHEKSGHEYLTNLIEKPEPGKAPTNLINVSKYILSPALRAYVKDVKPRREPAESYIIDAITAAAHDYDIAVHRSLGQYLDTGSPANWLHANNTVAAAITHK